MGDTRERDAVVNWISGPVLRATTNVVFHLNEAVKVGHQQLLGEVIRINGNESVIQVYEDTTGLRPGDTVTATGAPLSVKLGPALLGNIFDGLLRPLTGQGRYVKPGVGQDGSDKKYTFSPLIKEGDLLTRGSLFGSVHRADARLQRCMTPPDCDGRVVSIRPAGEYGEDETLCVLDCGDSGAPVPFR